VRRLALAAVLVAPVVAGFARAEQGVQVPVARATAENRARFAAGDEPRMARARWPIAPSRDAALGGDAFLLFPVGVDATWEMLIGDEAALRAAGVTVDASGEAIGLVLVEHEGRWTTGYSCALCHARADEHGRLRIGPANAALRYGDLLADTYPSHPMAARWRAWGPGRVDVTDDESDDPLRIPDLVALAQLRYLQQSGAVEGGPARRVEALLARSPRAGAAAHALSLAITAWLSEQSGPSPPAGAGAALFTENCARCHDGPALGGNHRIAAGLVGTDDRAARDEQRGTGAYRVAPLLGAGSRARFFHDGALLHLGDVLDPRRFDATFHEGALAPGPVSGHPWGTELAADARAALVAFLTASRW
jgi:hypothetical protein